MAEKLEGLSMNLEQGNKERLQSVFPECFSEGALDVDKLLALCGEYTDSDFEKYKFEWKGKAECLRLAQKRSAGTLRPCKEESVNFDTTENLYIEGDNLEVLKLLQTAYFRKVKMIYIDPPYNTGNDFVYEDDFKDPLAKYKEVTGQTTKSNPETMGRYHTNWLNMMYPRLRLAANLLRDDGVIFISIDDGEQANMRKLCDEVFGEENFRNCIAVRRGIKNVQAQFDEVSSLSVGHEYIYLYSKRSDMKFPKLAKSFEEKKAGKWDTFWRGTDRPTMRYELFDVTPEKGQWRWEKNRAYKAAAKYEEYLQNFSKEMSLDDYFFDCLTATSEKVDFVRKNEDGTIQYYVPPQSGKLLSDNWMDIMLSGMETVFDTEKSIAVMERIVGWILDGSKDEIVLDFFSGSGTTADAVLRLNAADGGNRKFICVQIPVLINPADPIHKSGYSNICEIAKERISNVGAKLLEATAQTTMDEQTNTLDVGFKVFKLDTSNLTEWDSSPVAKDDVAQLEERLNKMVEGVKKDRTDMDVVYEIMLKMGVPLDVPVTYLEINGKIVYVVGDLLLMICLAKDIRPEDMEQMADYAPGKIICAEESFYNDTALSNAHYIMRDRNIKLQLV